ncbi:MAG: hypothetical protein LBE83_02235, partial [Propionibacteriaceae bacterium]|nr:hypothetical protein [Propionibacteriaceae bacterium]
MNTQYSAQVASTRPTAVVIDDSSLTRAAFGQVYSALDVVATFSSVDAFLAAAFTVDVVILDLMLNPDLDTPMLQGPKAIQELTRRGHRVCIYSDERRMLILARCFSAGALGLARKSDPLEDNQAAFLRVA